MSQRAQTTETPGFTIQRTMNGYGETLIRVGEAEIYKDIRRGVWLPAKINYPCYGSKPVADVLNTISVLALACSLAAALDAEHPAGSVYVEPST